MKNTARLYCCARCHSQVCICSRCDRGNIYCGLTCSQRSRAQKHRIANQKYQKSLKGRQKNAARQRRYRQRQKDNIKKVTDQGSPDLPLNDLLPNKPSEDKSRQVDQVCCHFCGELVSPFLRTGYLRHHRHQSYDSASWPLGP